MDNNNTLFDTLNQDAKDYVIYLIESLGYYGAASFLTELFPNSSQNNIKALCNTALEISNKKATQLNP